MRPRVSAAQWRWLLAADEHGLIEDPANGRARRPLEALLDHDLIDEIPRQTRHEPRHYRLRPVAAQMVRERRAQEARPR